MNYTARWLVVAMLVAPPLAAQDTTAAAVANALRAAIAAVELPADRSELVVTRPALVRLYASSGARPIWTADGRPTAQAHRFVARLEAISDQGLPVEEYGGESLRRRIATLASRTGDVAERARFDVEMSVAAMRVLGHLHAGRVDLTTIGLHLPLGHSRTDLAALALDVARAPDVDAALAAIEPPYIGYRALTRLLPRYRALAGDSSLRPPRARAGVVRPGDAYDEAPLLRRFLRALGDGAPADGAISSTAEAERVQRAPAVAIDEPGDSLVYDEALAAAVRSFQERHGLVEDGLIGPATLAALRVPLARRVEQIELTLERWRWLSDAPAPRHVIVNVATFRLEAFVPDLRDRAALSMKVIVGEARRSHGTPIFFGTMNTVVFRPYWDVPASIARAELIPAIRHDPSYLGRQHLEIVRGGDDDAVIYPPTSHNLDRVLAGTLRLRQRPGPHNALGLIKFLFPNPYNVYLHGTPATQLFAHTRRDFSHGCIRIEDPPALAELVLRDQPGWDRMAIDAATNDTATRRVQVRDPVGVIVFYATAVVDDRGRARFAPDVYGHDARLRTALGR